VYHLIMRQEIGEACSLSLFSLEMMKQS